MDTNRLKILQSLLHDNHLDAYSINPGPSFRYMTGLDFHLMERPIVLFVPSRGKPIFILPVFEVNRLSQASSLVEIFGYSDNPAEWQNTFSNALHKYIPVSGKIGVEPLHLRLLEYHFLQSALPNSQFNPSANVIESMREIKSGSEVGRMRKAVEIAQAAFLAFLPYIRIGKTEKELAAELTIQLLKAGSDPTLPFNPIIASGPNSANPHAEPSDRRIQKSDLIVVDWGAGFEGYFSDLTRTLSIGTPSSEHNQIAGIVAAANRAAFNAAKPGIPAGHIDQAARQVIKNAGFDEFFIHRTGHGLGLEAHETPYIFAENMTCLKGGNVHTIEPGIYLPGKFGVRIEDNVVITDQGAECLSDLPRDLWIINTD